MKVSLNWRWAWREISHGQLFPVVAALTLIIACVFALSALASRVNFALSEQGRVMIAADLILRSNEPLAQSVMDDLSSINVEKSRQVRFNTMAFSQDEMQLIRVRAVESNYPLLGNLVLEGEEKDKSQVQANELWLEPRLFESLSIKIGDKVDIGSLTLVVSGILKSEPEQSFNPFNQMPVALIHYSNVDATEVIQPGSRVSYRYFFKGKAQALAKVKERIKITQGQRWIDEKSGNRAGEILERSQSYLSLTITLVLIMSAATLLLTCQSYTQSRTQTIAMIKSLGASKKWVVTWLTRQLSLLFFIGIVLGLITGALLEFIIRLPLTDVLPSPLPSYGILPWLLGPAVALIIALPAIGIPLLKLIDASALSVLQGAYQSTKTPKTRLLLIAVPVLCLVAWGYDNQLLWMVLFALAFMLVVLAALGVWILRTAKHYVTNASIKLALSRITRNPLSSGMQLGALATSFMLLAIIWLLRTDLLQDWQRALPQNAPNAFALNISELELTPYLARLDDQNIVRSDAFPVVRGRIVAKNGKLFTDLQPDEEKRDESLRREVNFTWRDEIPDHNTLVAGKWEEGEVSVEADVARRLGMSLGDKITFRINSQDFVATIGSLRGVEWRSMKPNFYFIFTPNFKDKLPGSWLVSFRLQEKDNNFIAQLSRDFQTVSLLDLRQMTANVQQILKQVSLSLSVLAALAVLSGLLLQLTLLRISMAQRQREIMLYRTLGASRKRINSTLWAEYGVMALVSGIIAVLGAEMALGALLKWGLALPVRLHPSLWIGLPTLALILVFISVNFLIKGLLEPLRK